MQDLFADDTQLWTEPLCPGAVVLRNFAKTSADALWVELPTLLAQSPLRQMQTPGGLRMSVATSSCGHCGWISDRAGYRYASTDPQTGQPWPPMPSSWLILAQRAAEVGGFPGFIPDTCLINRYQPGTRLSLHQDKDERDFNQPIVSVSLGLPAQFQFGGLQRQDPVQRTALNHGDVVVWGGPARRYFHGVLPLKPGTHPQLGNCRINLTFRRAR